MTYPKELDWDKLRNEFNKGKWGLTTAITERISKEFVGVNFKCKEFAKEFMEKLNVGEFDIIRIEHKGIGDSYGMKTFEIEHDLLKTKSKSISTNGDHELIEVFFENGDVKTFDNNFPEGIPVKDYYNKLFVSVPGKILYGEGLRESFKLIKTKK